MHGWLGSVFHGIASAVVGVLAIIGVGSTATHQPVIVPATQTGSTSVTESQATTTQSEVEALQQELDAEKTARLKLEAQISGTRTNTLSPAPPVTTASARAQTTPSKTFITPSGAVLDENGNVISAPPSNSQSTQPAVSAGKGVLTPSQIASLISPSVALITRPDGGRGSGFVIEGGKYILTNEHVVGTYPALQVSLPSGSYNAPVLGKDKSVDLALLYIGGHNAPAVTLGSSAESFLSIGDDVYALGFPLSTSEGLTNLTLTKGILSARQKPSWSSISMLQTDASINHGNSGGPLVNSKGEVIGINSDTTLEPSQGIGFAIPIDTAKNWIPSLSQNGQSRYELHPLGSTIDIAASVLDHLEINPKVDCAGLGFTTAEISVCQFYRAYKNDYHWNILKNQ